MKMLRCPKHLVAIAPLLLTLMLGACATRAQQPTGVTFVVVRHAEKADDGSKDPPLTEAGLARAQALGNALRDAPLRAVYATAYRRTQQTAEPSARMRALPVVTYDAKLAASDFVAQLRRDHAAGTVLVVGHSNTAPGIAAALCQCTVPAMGDNEYDRWISIHVDGNGGATLKEERY
jgi:broad specificity phosphatase PhoE